MVSSVLALFNLWDFYYFGLRPFDIIGFLIITYYFFSKQQNSKSIPYNKSGFILILFLITWVYIMIGILGNLDTGITFGKFFNTSKLVLNIKSAIGFILGLISFSIFYYLIIKKIDLIKCLDFIILIHITSFFIQYSYYLFTGEILNPHYYTENAYGATGLRSHGYGFFRPSGLFVESASYAFTMYMLITLRLSIEKVYNYKIIIGLISTLLSFSLWGFISIIIIILSFRPKTVYLVSFSAVLIGSFIFIFNKINIINILLIGRIKNFFSDVSFVDRYGSLFLNSDNLSTFDYFFGMGIMPGTDNSLISLIRIFGIFGLTIILLIINILAGKGYNFRLMFLILLLLAVSGQLLTILLFWVWLALMIKSNQKIILSMENI